MTLQARLTCSEGSALRFPGAIPMVSGDSAVVTIAVADTKEAPDAKSSVTDAQNAPGLGVDGVKDGVVAVTAIGGTIKVREYMEVNPFAGENQDYIDHIVRNGESVSAETVGSNAKTLVVMGPA